MWAYVWLRNAPKLWLDPRLPRKVQVISPRFEHSASFFLVGVPVVGRTHSVGRHMCQAMFNHVHACARAVEV